MAQEDRKDSKLRDPSIREEPKTVFTKKSTASILSLAKASTETPSVSRTPTQPLSHSKIHIKLKDFENQFKQLKQDKKNDSKLQTELEKLYISVSNLLYAIYLSDPELNIIYATKLLRAIEADLLAITTPPISTEVVERKTRATRKTNFSTDIQLLIVEFLTAQNLIDSVSALYQLFPDLFTQAQTESSCNRINAFWRKKIKTAFDPLVPGREMKIENPSFAGLIAQKKARQEALDRFYQIHKNHEIPLKKILLLIMILHEGDLHHLPKDFFRELFLQRKDLILPIEYNPFILLYRKFKHTEHKKYQDFLQFLIKKLLARYGISTNTTSGKIKKDSFWNQNKAQIIPNLIASKSLEWLKENLASQDLLNTNVLMHAILAGNIDLCEYIINNQINTPSLLPNGKTLLFTAIIEHQFDIAKFFYNSSLKDNKLDKTFDNDKSPEAKTVLNENVRRELLQYLAHGQMLSSDNFLAIIKFLDDINCDETSIEIFKSYQKIYDKFISGLLTYNKTRIQNAMDNLEEFLKKHPTIPFTYEAAMANWLSIAHRELSFASVAEFLALSPPTQALEIATLFPFLYNPISQFANKIHSLPYLRDPRSIDIPPKLCHDQIDLVDHRQTIAELAVETAFYHNETSFIDSFMDQLNLGKLSISHFRPKYLNFLLLIGLRQNKQKYIDLALYRGATIEKALPLAITADANKDDNFTTIECLTKYMEMYCRENKASPKDAAKKLHSIFFSYGTEIFPLPPLFAAIQTQNLKLIKSLFNMIPEFSMYKLNKHQTTPLTYAIQNCNLETVILIITLGQKTETSTKNIYDVRWSDRDKLREFYSFAIKQKDVQSAEILYNFITHARIDYGMNIFKDLQRKKIDISKDELLKLQLEPRSSSTPTSTILSSLTTPSTSTTTSTATTSTSQTSTTTSVSSSSTSSSSRFSFSTSSPTEALTPPSNPVVPQSPSTI